MRNIPAMDIHWEDPPSDALFKHENKGGKYIDYALALREHPGRWAVLPEDAAKTRGSAAGLAQSIRAGSTKGFKPKGSYDAFHTTEKDDDERETYKVYVRYLGEPGSKEAEEDDTPPTPVRRTVTERGNGDDDPPDDPDDAQPVHTSKAPIREWARENGWPQIGAHGRLPEGVLDAYEHAQEREQHAS